MAPIRRTARGLIVGGMTTSQRIDATIVRTFAGTLTAERAATTGRNRYLTPTKKGWFSDPQGQHQFRYHDGQRWTQHTTHFGPSPCTGCHT